MTVEITPALVGLAGVIVGGAIQAGVQLVLARRNHLLTKKSEAYLTFFQGLAATSHARTEKDFSAANELMAEGRALIAVYGSEVVVMAMAEAFRREGKLHDEGAWQVHAAMLKAMREDIFGKAYSSDIRLLFEVLYGAKEREK